MNWLALIQFLNKLIDSITELSRHIRRQASLKKIKDRLAALEKSKDKNATRKERLEANRELEG